MTPIAFVCPQCHGSVAFERHEYRCEGCDRRYPVICGIPDFRLEPDPYISIEEDRTKGAALHEGGRSLSFEALVRHYYAITPDDPPDLAARWTARALQEVEIARALASDTAGVHGSGPRGTLLDVGCSTGARLIALRDRYAVLVGVDVAFRWLVIGAARLRETGVSAQLICANAEHLPFAPQSFDAVSAIDVLEHVRGAGAAAREAFRVSAPNARLSCTANNRFALAPEPNISIWGVGWLPRRWQPRYVAWRRRDLHPYHIHLPSAVELRGWLRAAGYTDIRVEPGRLDAPHAQGRWRRRLLAIYHAVRRLPIARTLLLAVGPKLAATAVRPSSAPQGGAMASSARPLSTTARADT